MHERAHNYLLINLPYELVKFKSLDELNVSLKIH